MVQKNADLFMQEGCGRCDKFQTDDCKVRHWQTTLHPLRELMQSTGLDEEMKWGFPTYSAGGANVVMLAVFKDHCTLSFFDGVALRDEEGVLESPGPNSRSARYLKFTSPAEVAARRDVALDFVGQAVALKKSGKKVVRKSAPEPIPDELAQRLHADAELRAAFDALTPGRRRSHILHVSGAAQAATRVRRAEKCAPAILAGKGFNER